MEQRDNKTVMCSVLFLDIVEYSKKPVSGQIALRDRFNAFLSEAIRDVPLSDRIILDTGDGAAISFLGDVEDALKAALSLRENLFGESAQAEPPLMVRMGINLGPVRLVRDINGQPNIVGDGINVAQRIMGFANSRQILVSRSYYEAVSRLSPEYAGMFDYQGACTDKHVRDHEVYAINNPGDISAPQAETAAGATVKQDGMFAPVKGYWEAAAKWLDDGVRGFAKASGSQRVLFVGVLAIPLIFLAAVVVKVAYRSPAPAPQVAVAPTEVAVAPAPSEAVPPKPEADQPVLKTFEPAPAEIEKPGDKISASPGEAQKPPKAGPPAIVNIAVSPWGEIYLDGRMKGISPPLTRLQVTPGKHEIEIRNTTLAAYRLSIRVKAGEEIKIRHKFSN